MDLIKDFLLSPNPPAQVPVSLDGLPVPFGKILTSDGFVDARHAEGPNEGPNEGPLPCLSSNNSTEQEKQQLITTKKIDSTQYRKSATALAWNVGYMAEKYGLNNIGFLTLTFAEDIQDPKEAQRRFNSLRTHVLKNRYDGYIRVFERQKSGRIHYHLLVNCGSDIRRGANFQEFEDRNYKSANANLRKEWAFWRETAKEFGFGRTELLPVKSNKEAIGRYVGKYIGKHMEARDDEDKGVRLVDYSKEGRVVSTRFQFHTLGAASWRRKLRLFAEWAARARGGFPLQISDISGLTKILGPHWAFEYRDHIVNLPDPLQLE